MSQDRQTTCMEKPLDVVQVGLRVGWGRVSGNQQGRQNRISQVDGDSDMVLPVPAGGGLRKRTMASANTPIWERQLPLQPSPQSNTVHFFPCMSLASFKLLAWGWNSVSKFEQVVCGPVKGRLSGTPEALHLTQLPSLWFSQLEVTGIFLPLWNPGLRSLVRGWVFLLLGDFCS